MIVQVFLTWFLLSVLLHALAFTVSIALRGLPGRALGLLIPPFLFCVSFVLYWQIGVPAHNTSTFEGLLDGLFDWGFRLFVLVVGTILNGLTAWTVQNIRRSAEFVEGK